MTRRLPGSPKQSSGVPDFPEKMCQVKRNPNWKLD